MLPLVRITYFTYILKADMNTLGIYYASLDKTQCTIVSFT